MAVNAGGRTELPLAEGERWHFTAAVMADTATKGELDFFWVDWFCRSILTVTSLSEGQSAGSANRGTDQSRRLLRGLLQWGFLVDEPSFVLAANGPQWWGCTTAPTTITADIGIFLIKSQSRSKQTSSLHCRTQHSRRLCFGDVSTG